MSQSPKILWHSIPSSTSTCKVHLMQAGGLYIPEDLTLLPGADEPNDSINSERKDTKRKTFYAPDYVFLIEHVASGYRYIFDLGMRKDLENLPPLIKDNILPQFKCEPQSPVDILRKHGSKEQQPEHVKAVIFSHIHFDHVGDGAKAGFGEAEMWIGPTCCTYARPGYPIDPRSPNLTDSLPTDGSRKIIEAYIPDDMLPAGDKRAGKVMEALKRGLYNGTDIKKQDWISVGAFDHAFDCFGDGSAYLIDAPGHSPGHQMMLIRTTSTSKDDSTFVLLAGDCFHHPDILQDPQRTARPPYSKESMHADPETAIGTIWRTRKCAEREEIWVTGAHDFMVGEGIERGVKEIEGLVDITGWRDKGWKKQLSGSN